MDRGVGKVTGKCGARRSHFQHWCGAESEKVGDFVAVVMGGKDKKHSREINIDVCLSDAHGPP
jgi:hypothetical protein